MEPAPAPAEEEPEAEEPPTEEDDEAGLTVQEKKYKALVNRSTGAVTAQLSDSGTFDTEQEAIDSVAVALVGEKYYNTVPKACASVKTSDQTTIKLLKDSTSESNIGLYLGSWSDRTGGKNIILDLNGHTYTQNKTNGTGAFVLAPKQDFTEGSSLTIKDSSEGKTGKVTSNSQYCTIISGSECDFTLESGTIENTGGGQPLQVSRCKSAAPVRLKSRAAHC